MNVLARWVRRGPAAAAAPERALEAAAAWLARAQDASGCDGVSAHYDLARHAWAAAYPETTGYIIPTLLRYADLSGQASYRDRALRMAAWECDIQLEGGGVQAGTLDAGTVVPTIFNTGQVMFGWLAAWRDTGEERFRASLQRGAEWLVDAQDADGAWRRFGSPFARSGPNTYNTRVAFALAEAGQALGEQRYIDAAVHNVRWALGRMHANGWLEGNDLEDNTRPLVHTVAYAARGILEVGLISRQTAFVDAATCIARAVARAQRADGALPGRLDADWRAASSWSCVTGNAQMAIIWLRLASETGERPLQDAADRAIAFNGSLQELSATDPGVRGGMPGSAPRRGGYMKLRYPNWAAKFFMDALMLQPEGRRRHA